MTPNRMTEHQSELIENLMEENVRLHQEIDELNYKLTVSSVSYLRTIQNCWMMSNRNFRISIILSVLLIIETVYILWVK